MDKKKLNQIKSLVIFWSAVFASLLFFVILIWVSADKIIMPSVIRLGDEHKVPDLVHMNFTDAMEKLETEGFQLVKSEEKVDYKVPKGAIIEQTPRAGSLSKKGRKIFVTVSSGKLPVKVPNLLTISPQDAKYRITDSRLLLDTIFYDFSKDYPEGVVMGQSISSGSMAEVGDSIFIVVSLGKHPNEYIVPDVIGLPLSEAAKEINKSGFSVGYITKIVDNNLIPGTIVRQYPEPEMEAAKGSEIELYVIKEEN